jgi:hypothetical protein
MYFEGITFTGGGGSDDYGYDDCADDYGGCDYYGCYP